MICERDSTFTHSIHFKTSHIKLINMEGICETGSTVSIVLIREDLKV